MSEHLANLGILRDVIRMHQPAQASHDSTLELILLELVNRIEHLEAQQETPASASQPTEQPAPSSSEATEMAEETKPISSISWRQSYLVNQGGFHYSDPAQDILDWLSSHRLAGMGPEVEIGVTLTSKASTLQSGSASPSTGDLTREASGVAGRSIPCPDGIEGCAVLHLSPASSPEPAQGESDWAVLMSNMLYTLETDNAGHLRVNGLEYELMPSRTMKEGSERG